MNGSMAAALWPQRSAAQETALVVLGAVLTSLCAQVAIPGNPVPFTMQTFAVTVCGLTLGARAAFLSQLTYLIAGAAGLPVFAEYSGGPQHLVGPTGGYLLSFLPAAALLGYVADQGLARRGWSLAIALVVANLLILGVGVTWLAFFVPQAQVMNAGFWPFIPAAFIKSALAWATLPVAWHRVDRR
ncbi:MAG: biotin transporter BioY [Fimbriimonadaceae bacterium]|nr:biotin transporter BioY [Fimbriimonadaceae bacterium]